MMNDETPERAKVKMTTGIEKLRRVVNMIRTYTDYAKSPMQRKMDGRAYSKSLYK
jgi:hypothetical protein